MPGYEALVVVLLVLAAVLGTFAVSSRSTPDRMRPALVRGGVVALVLLSAAACSSAPAAPQASPPAVARSVGDVQTLDDGATVQVVAAREMSSKAMYGRAAADYLAVEVRVCVAALDRVSAEPWAIRAQSGDVQSPAFLLPSETPGLSAYPSNLSPVMQPGECVTGWLFFAGAHTGATIRYALYDPTTQVRVWQ